MILFLTSSPTGPLDGSRRVDGLDDMNCFLEKQLQLFPEEVASTPEEAADFLEMCFAVVAKSKKEVRRYFEEVGTDIDGEDIFSASEVFPVGDGRYLIVEG